MYDSEDEAAQAWDRVSYLYRGKVQDLNFPQLEAEYRDNEVSGWGKDKETANGCLPMTLALSNACI